MGIIKSKIDWKIVVYLILPGHYKELSFDPITGHS